MTEKEIRRIVREEIEALASDEGGLYDHCRAVAFNMFRQVMLQQAQQTIASFRSPDDPTN